MITWRWTAAGATGPVLFVSMVFDALSLGAGVYLGLWIFFP